MKMNILCVGLLACWWAAPLEARSFVTVVAADGSGDYRTLQEAVNACPADGDRHLIFVKNGVYAERVNLPKGKLISLLGESRDGVVLTNDRNRGKNSPYRNFRDITTLQCYGDDFYMENLTVRNTAGNVGQAEAHFIAGARQVYRDCRFTGYQDTQRTKNGAYAYLQNCRIEGAVDFIYGDGLMYYDHCTIHSVKGGGYLTAPAECAHTTEPAADGKPLHYGYIFRNCNLTADRDVPAGSYYLGRRGRSRRLPISSVAGWVRISMPRAGASGTAMRRLLTLPSPAAWMQKVLRQMSADGWHGVVSCPRRTHVG